MPHHATQPRVEPQLLAQSVAVHVLGVAKTVVVAQDVGQKLVIVFQTGASTPPPTLPPPPGREAKAEGHAGESIGWSEQNSSAVGWTSPQQHCGTLQAGAGVPPSPRFGAGEGGGGV